MVKIYCAKDLDQILTSRLCVLLGQKTLAPLDTIATIENQSDVESVKCCNHLFQAYLNIHCLTVMEVPGSNSRNIEGSYYR